MSARAQRPLRVGMVIGQLSTGGAEGQLRLLCERGDRAAVAPTVYCLSGETHPYGPILERAGVPVRVLTGGGLTRVARLRWRLHADRIDVVHAWLFIANAFAWAAGGAPLVTSARNCKRSGWRLDALNQRAFRASRKIIVNSAQVQAYIEREYRAPHDRIAVVHNAVDTERFRPRGEQPAAAGPRVLAMGRLVAQKNPLLFVSAAAALRQHYPGARFAWIGDGPLRTPVAAAVSAAGLDDCCDLLGERGDVAELLRSADLFWMTSDWEGLPNAIIEALASGLPVVATNVGGTAELIGDGGEGFLIAPGDADALVARSLSILADPAAHARMRSAARARAELFSVEQMVRATYEVYDAALRGGAA